MLKKGNTPQIENYELCFPSLQSNCIWLNNLYSRVTSKRNILYHRATQPAQYPRPLNIIIPTPTSNCTDCIGIIFAFRKAPVRWKFVSVPYRLFKNQTHIPHTKILDISPDEMNGGVGRRQKKETSFNFYAKCCCESPIQTRGNTTFSFSFS